MEQAPGHTAGDLNFAVNVQASEATKATKYFVHACGNRTLHCLVNNKRTEGVP